MIWQLRQIPCLRFLTTLLSAAFPPSLRILYRANTVGAPVAVRPVAVGRTPRSGHARASLLPPSIVDVTRPDASWVFQSVGQRSGGQLTGKPVSQRNAHGISRRRAEAAGIKTKIGKPPPADEADQTVEAYQGE